MKILKALWLTILGWFTSKAEAKVDLRHAGKAHFDNVRAKIEDVYDQRNSLAGRHRLAKKTTDKVKEEMDKAAAAVKHWNVNGDKEKEDKAYALYTKLHAEHANAVKDEEDLYQQVVDLDTQIESLEKDADKAERELQTAATQQQVGRATSAVEDIHSDLNTGALSQVIKSSELQSATAEAKKELRRSKDNSDILDIDIPKALSREDLLK